jgi:hypothetical protein
MVTTTGSNGSVRRLLIFWSSVTIAAPAAIASSPRCGRAHADLADRDLGIDMERQDRLDSLDVPRLDDLRRTEGLGLLGRLEDAAHRAGPLRPGRVKLKCHARDDRRVNVVAAGMHDARIPGAKG